MRAYNLLKPKWKNKTKQNIHNGKVAMSLLHPIKHFFLNNNNKKTNKKKLQRDLWAKKPVFLGCSLTHNTNSLLLTIILKSKPFYRYILKIHSGFLYKTILWRKVLWLKFQVDPQNDSSSIYLSPFIILMCRKQMCKQR